MISLRVLEEDIDASGVAARIEAMLPTGVRRRQLSVRTLLAGLVLALADGRPARAAGLAPIAAAQAHPRHARGQLCG